MRRSRLLVLISILALIFLFGTSALTEQCTISPASKADEQDNVKDALEETVEDIELGEETLESANKEESDEIEKKEENEETTKDGNSNPIVYDINITGGTPLLWPESKYNISATASDPDGDSLTYYWSVSGGSFDDIYSNPTVWNTPDTGGTYSITVSVNDGNGGFDEKTIEVFISQVSYPINSNPVIVEIKLVGAIFTIDPGTKYGIYANAFDPDGDNITYEWTVSGGSIDDVNAKTTAWNTPDSLGSYTIQVEIEDGRGGYAVEIINVNVGSQIQIGRMDVPIVWQEGGSISPDEIGYRIANNHIVGDTYTNEQCKGFISFDITNLSGANITGATLTVNNSRIIGDPSGFIPLWVSSANWEPGNIVLDDFNIPVDLIQEFSTLSFICDSPNLKSYIQDAINSGRDRFQVVLFFNGMATDNDNDYDIWEYSDYGINLEVFYTP